MIDLSALNDEQRDAVLDFDHNLLILACAGSGKTRTITQKIAYAVSEGIYKPYQILAVTFTNRAADEMRSRVAAALPGEDISGMEMRTFHSFGAYILRRYGTKAGLSPLALTGCRRALPSLQGSAARDAPTPPCPAPRPPR